MFIESNLGAGEKIVYRARLSTWPLFPSYLLGFVLIPLLIGIVLLIRTSLQQRSTEVAVTNYRLVVKFGVLRTRVYDLPLNRVESVRVDQSLWGRLLSFGDVHVAGTGTTVEPLFGISSPADLRNAVLQEELQKNHAG